MARLRFVGPVNPDPGGNDLGHTVPLLGGRTVRADEVVEIPDEWLTEYTWPDVSWRVEDERKRSNRTAAKVEE